MTVEKGLNDSKSKKVWWVVFIGALDFLNIHKNILYVV